MKVIEVEKMTKLRKISFLCITALLIVALVFPVFGNAQVGQDSNIQYQESPILGSSQLITNAQAAVLYEYSTETFMYAWNADNRVSPSSLVKIMTALLAVQKGNMDDVVCVTQDVLSTVAADAMSVDLLDGELLTLEQLLYCMMVGSANDAAAVIADHISGSQASFVQEMNDFALAVGCQNTVFTNVHGLHDDNQYSTARDVALILAEAMKNETFRTIFGTALYTVPATNLSEQRELSSNNYLINTDVFDIYFDPRVTGGRGGTAENGDRCLAATAQENGLQVISVIIGAKSVYEEDGYTVRSYGSFNETKALLDIGLTGYKAVQILYPGQVLKQLRVQDGNASVSITPDSTVSTILPVDATLSNLAFQYEFLQQQISAPVEKDQLLGSLKVYFNSTCIAQSQLFALNAVEQTQANQIDPQKDGSQNVWAIVGKVLAVIAGVLVLVLIVRFLVRKIHLSADAKRSRRYRRSRRRSR